VNPSILKETPPWEWPPSARETIKNVLRDHSADPSDRTDAAQLAGDLIVMDDDMADLLLATVASAGEPDELRAMAAISLGPALEDADVQGYDDDLSTPAVSEEKFLQIRETLRSLYADQSVSKDVRRRALEASVRAPEEWHRDAILEAAASDDEEWKLTAAFGMRWIDGFEDEILEMLESPNPEIYYEAIQAAGNREVEGAWPHVATVLVSPEIDKVLLLAAIEAAPSVNREEAQPLLRELLDHEDEDIAEAASEALTMAQFDPSELEGEEDDDLLSGEEDEEDDRP
jgi:HEAT repeat protein